MIKIARFLKNNWPYIFMLIFIIFVTSFFALAEKYGKPIKAKRPEVRRIEPMDFEKALERQKAVNELYDKNFPLYLLLIAINAFIILIFFAGLALNILLIYKRKRKEEIIQRTLPPPEVKWNIADIARFGIMFYAFSYTFMLLVAALAGKYPLFANRNFLFIFNTTVIDTAGIIFVLNFVVYIYRQRVETIGLSLKNFFRNIFYGIAGYVAVIPVLLMAIIITAIAVTIFKYSPPVQPIVDVLLKEDKISMLIYSSLFAAIAGPIMEEIFFRGFMYNAFKKRIGVFGGIIFTSSVFSLLHAHPVGFVPIMILGILLAYLYEKTGSLIPSITVHITHNLASVFMVFLIKRLGFY